MVVSNIFIFTPGEDEPILTNIFQMGSNHQLVYHKKSTFHVGRFLLFVPRIGNGFSGFPIPKNWGIFEDLLHVGKICPYICLDVSPDYFTKPCNNCRVNKYLYTHHRGRTRLTRLTDLTFQRWLARAGMD